MVSQLNFKMAINKDIHKTWKMITLQILDVANNVVKNTFSVAKQLSVARLWYPIHYCTSLLHLVSCFFFFNVLLGLNLMVFYFDISAYQRIQSTLCYQYCIYFKKITKINEYPISSLQETKVQIQDQNSTFHK